MWSGIGLPGRGHFGNQTVPARVVHESRATCTRLSSSCGRHNAFTPCAVAPLLGECTGATERQQSTCNRTAMHGCQNVVACAVRSTALMTPLPASVAGAAAGTALPTWLANPVTEDPTAGTSLPKPAATGAPVLDCVGLDGGGGPGVVAAPLDVTSTRGSLPERLGPAGGGLNASTPEPMAPEGAPGSVGSAVAAPEVKSSSCLRSVAC